MKTIAAIAVAILIFGSFHYAPTKSIVAYNTKNLSMVSPLVEQDMVKTVWKK